MNNDIEETGVSIMRTVGAMHQIRMNQLPETLKAPARLVLLIIASYADNSTGECFPSQKRLAREAGLSLSALRTQLKTLVDAGLILMQPRTTESEHGKVCKTTSIYKVLTPRFTGRKIELRDSGNSRDWAEGF